MAEKRIQKMRLKKGSFKDYCGWDVTESCIKKWESSSDTKTRKRATLARTFRRLSK